MILLKRFYKFGSLVMFLFIAFVLSSISQSFPFDYIFQFYDSLVKTGTQFFTLDQANQAGIMYHSISNLFGFELKAHKSLVYTGLKLRYTAVGELK